jgi:hypothetical protein
MVVTGRSPPRSAEIYTAGGGQECPDDWLLKLHEHAGEEFWHVKAAVPEICGEALYICKYLLTYVECFKVIIDEVIKIYRIPGGSNMISDPNFSLKGVPHCEAVLACSHYLANSKEFVDTSVVSEAVLAGLVKASTLIAPSKRCCPVCAATQHELAKHSGKLANYPVYSKHKRIRLRPPPRSP